MSNESVAVLDIRSYEVTFLIGAKGVNDTFVFRGGTSEKYEGYSSDGFLDAASFRRAVIAAVTSVRQNYEGTVKEIFVGVRFRIYQGAYDFLSLEAKNLRTGNRRLVRKRAG